MADIEFDDGAAERLIAAAVITDDGMRGQGGTRASAAEDALWNFEGAYSQRFLSECRSRQPTEVCSLVGSRPRPTRCGQQARVLGQRDGVTGERRPLVDRQRRQGDSTGRQRSDVVMTT